MNNKTPSAEEFLAHYGVKGMKWGVVKEDKPSGARKGAAKEDAPTAKAPSKKEVTEAAAKFKYFPDELTDKDRAVLKAAGMDVNDAAMMQAKYGPGSFGDPPPSRFTPRQKQVALAVALGVGALGAAYMYGNRSELTKALTIYNKVKETKGNGLSLDDVAKLRTDRVDLAPGSILKRVSTIKETQIRPGGFYASHDDEDVARYKAILPVFWRMWGIDSGEGGYVVNIKANKGVKAPSERETFDIFKRSLQNKIVDDGMFPGNNTIVSVRQYLQKEHYSLRNLTNVDDDTFARRAFYEAAVQWLDKDNPVSNNFFQVLRSEGFNAVLDMNDVGSLASRPLRMLDSTDFSVAGHDRLTVDAIKTAQETIQALNHFEAFMDSYFSHDGDEELENFLAHYGVKGMKWGTRKGGTEGVPRKTDREASKDAKEFARAKLFYGEGAGTRRKLIKAKVETRKSKDPLYAKAFDNHYGQQDLGKHADKVKGERRRKDTKERVRKTGNSINRAINGPFAGSAAIAAVAAGTAYVRNTGMDQRAASYVRGQMANLQNRQALKREVNNLLKGL